MLTALIVLPMIAAALFLIVPYARMQYWLAAAAAAALSCAALVLYGTPGVVSFFPLYGAEELIAAADAVLILYFIYQGVTFNARLVTLLGGVQWVLYGWAEWMVPDTGGAFMIVDDLSKFMFLIINIVGGVIIVYAVEYMRYEERLSPFQKRLFIAYLLLFLSVMNALVCANSLLLFFFLFELTTLASYLLISFRGDPLSRENALRALWMNQIGGVVILLGTLAAIYGVGSAMFDAVLADSAPIVLLVAALLGMAALVKGASLPFDGWLLGAMVAPTPVSAMLHSAAMVKIAPYLILKLSPLLSFTAVGDLLCVIGAGVFVAASYLALSRLVFKEILGYSTIALLGLMMSIAAIGTPESRMIAMVLIVFHALSKALLFLSAGVLEKQYHVKEIGEMKGMVERAPKSVGFILLGFVSLTLPPFGLFMGKVWAIVSVSSLLREHPWMIIVLMGMIVGSVLLVLLYFKVASALFSNASDTLIREREILRPGFLIPSAILSGLIVVSAAGLMVLYGNVAWGWVALALAAGGFIPGLVRFAERFDRGKPYHCGERESFDAALVYFSPSDRVKRMLYGGFAVLFVAVACVGVLA